MHGFGRVLAILFVPLAGLASALAPKLAQIAHRNKLPGDFDLAAFVVSAGLVAVVCCIWASWERARFVGLKQSTRRERAQSRAALCMRDAIIEGGQNAIVVLGEDVSAPLSFGGGSLLLQACLAGPDAAALAFSLNALLKDGAPFDMAMRTSGKRMVAARGLPIGRRAVIFMREEDAAESARAEFRAVLDALPVPVWLRRSDLSLCWANAAYVAATGTGTLKSAIAENATLDRSEHDLAMTAAEGRDVAGAKRYACIGGERRALSFTLRKLPDSTVAGIAVDVTDAIETTAELRVKAEYATDVLDKLEKAIAVFGPDRRLTAHNLAYSQLWGLPRAWLDTNPSDDEIYDRLRTARRLPEMADFRAWKRDLARPSERDEPPASQLWHLPGGRSLSVTTMPHPLGGFVVLYTDVTFQLRQESANRMLAQVHKATIDALQEPVASFGPDGCLKFYSDAFAKLWHLEEAELSNEPHVNRIAQLCASRIGPDETWDIVASAVNASEPEHYNEWTCIKRSDGATLMLSLNRLPDGATFVHFENVTDVSHFDSFLKSDAEVAA